MGFVRGNALPLQASVEQNLPWQTNWLLATRGDSEQSAQRRTQSIEQQSALLCGGSSQ